MGRWIKKTNPHVCRKPNAGRKGVGSEWRCRCGQVWRITRKTPSSPGGAYMTIAWTPVSSPGEDSSR